MPKQKDDQIHMLMQGDWSKAFVALNGHSKGEIEKARRRYRWLNMVMPKSAVKNMLG